MKVTIQFDGGCKPNPGKMYGSYAIWFDGKQVANEQEQQYGYGTNNVAEFTALFRAVQSAMNQLQAITVDPRFCHVEIITDSRIIRNRVAGKPRNRPKNEGAQRMMEWAIKVKGLLCQFGQFKAHWKPRIVNVRKFGH